MHPQVFTSVHAELVFDGADIRPADVERAIELSHSKYNAGSAMLRASVRLSHTYRIEAPKTVAGRAG